MIKISVLTPTIRPEGLEIVKQSLSEQTFKDFEWITEINTTGAHDLNAAYNRMLRKAKGELIVSLQDYIKVPPDYLQKFWDAHQAYPNSFITAPVGKVDNLAYQTPAKWDWRSYRQNDTDIIRDCEWNCWEIDSGCAPLSALKKIGGFDEELDGHWSGDNVNVGCRAQIDGFDFKCLFDNPALAYDHDAFMEHPFRGYFNGAVNTKRMVMFRGGMRIQYL